MKARQNPVFLSHAWKRAWNNPPGAWLLVNQLYSRWARVWNANSLICSINVPRSFQDGLQLLPSCLWSIASGIRKSCSGAFNPLDISCATLFQRGFPTFSLQPKWLPGHACRIRVENGDLTYCCLLLIHLSRNLELQKLEIRKIKNELNPHPRLKKTPKKKPIRYHESLGVFPRKSNPTGGSAHRKHRKAWSQKPKNKSRARQSSSKMGLFHVVSKCPQINHDKHHQWFITVFPHQHEPWKITPIPPHQNLVAWKRFPYYGLSSPVHYP